MYLADSSSLERSWDPLAMSGKKFTTKVIPGYCSGMSAFGVVAGVDLQ
jgi:hypothetical protein